MSKLEIIDKIAAIDAELSNQRFNRTMTAEQMRKLRCKREALEKKLYK